MRRPLFGRIPTTSGTLSHSTARSSQAGFTLIELMVVVLIIGILVAIAVLAFSNSQNTSKDNAAKSNLKNLQTLALSTVVNGAATNIAVIDATTFNGRESGVVINGTAQDTTKPQVPYVLTAMPTSSSTQTVWCAKGSGSNVWSITLNSTGTMFRGNSCAAATANAW